MNFEIKCAKTNAIVGKFYFDIGSFANKITFGKVYCE